MNRIAFMIAVIAAAAAGFFIRPIIMGETPATDMSSAQQEMTQSTPDDTAAATAPATSEAPQAAEMSPDATAPQQQAEAAPAPAPQPQAEPLVVSDDTMQEFVKINQQLNALQISFQKEMEAAQGDAAKTEAAMMKKNENLQAIFKDSPLSVPDYSRIAQMLPNDPALQAQFSKFLK